MHSSDRSDLLEFGEAFLEDELGCSQRKTFGHIAWYAGRKMVAFLWEDGIGVKMAPEEVLRHIARDSERYRHFDPGDGVMKNWLIVVPEDASELEREKELFHEAVARVR